MDELYEEYPKLPKNIHQIGEREEAAKIYVEDYVNTYLRRLYPDPGKLMRIGILLGNLEVHEGVPFIFVDGALEMEDACVEGERVQITDEAWKKAHDDMGRCFPKSEVLGWFLCAGPGVNLNPITYWNQHGEYFPGKYKLLYLNHTTDVDESLYMTSIEGFYRLAGYYIYYERNPCMQDYMVLRRDVRRVEAGVDDSAARNFKMILQEKKGEAGRKKNTHMMYGICSFLLILLVAGGVTMMNNYDKMKTMEVALANLSENVVGMSLPASKETEGYIKESETGKGIVVEHIQGGVSMTEAQTEGLDPPGTEAAVTVASQESSTAASVPDMPSEPESQPAASAESQAQGESKPAASIGESQPAGTQPEEKPKPSDAAVNKEEQASIETREAKKPAADDAAAAAGKVHVVEAGETLYSICLAQYHSVSKVEEICELNQLENPDKITIGQKLVLP